MASHAEVGILQILEPYVDFITKEESSIGWKIFFATREYFTKDREGNYRLNNEHVEKKRMLEIFLSLIIKFLIYKLK